MEEERRGTDLASPLLYRPKSFHESAPVHAGIVKHNECVLADTHRLSVRKSAILSAVIFFMQKG